MTEVVTEDEARASLEGLECQGVVGPWGSVLLVNKN